MAGENRIQVNALKDLRVTLNKASGRKEYDIVISTCQQIITLAGQAPALGIIVPLYHKDMGEAYLRLLQYEDAIESLQTAHTGLSQYRATQKLKFEDDWLRELAAIEKLIHKIETVHLKLPC